jgi:hypothetical protein
LLAGFTQGFQHNYADYGNNSFVGTDGSSGTTYASCGDNTKLSPQVDSTWGPSPEFSGCAGFGSNYVLIGGSNGDAANQGPPDEEYPATVSGSSPPPGNHNQWQVYFAGNETGAHAVCVPAT